MTEPVGVGLVGCGRAGRELHLPAMTRLSEVKLVAVAETDAGIRRAVVEGHPGARGYESHRALLEDPAVEAVAVCVPPRFHADVAVEALRAGKHLLLEKPIATTLEEADRVLAASREARTTAMLGLNLRFHPVVARAHEAMGSGALGRVRTLNSVFTSVIAARRRLPEWRRDRARGGGVLYELGTHHFDLWRHLTGAEVEEVFASTRSIEGDDDVAAVTASLSDGSLATGLFAQCTTAANELEAQGEGRRLRLSCYAFDGPHLETDSTPPGSPRRRLARGMRTLGSLPDAVKAARWGGVFRSTYAREWRHFAACIRTSAPPAATLEDGHRALEVTLAAVESAGAGRPVRLAPASPEGDRRAG